MEKGSTLKYRQVEEYLRRQILSHVWRPGDQLPSHGELRTLFGCTQATIERAHSLLESDGLIERRHRLGTFVVDPSGAVPAPAGPAPVRDTIAVASYYGHDAPMPGVTGWESSIVQGAVSTAQSEDMLALLLDPSRLIPEEIGRLWVQPLAGVVVGLSSLRPELLERIKRGLLTLDLPVVGYGNVPQFSPFDCVTSDHSSGARMLTKYLVERGCRKILNVEYRDTGIVSYWQPERQAGYEAALQAVGLQPVPAVFLTKFEEPWTGVDTGRYHREIEFIRHQLSQVLAQHPDCDGILVESDGLVDTLADAARQLGREPGRDILFTGYDNYWSPAMFRQRPEPQHEATIDKHNFALGASAVQLLLARLRGELPDVPQRWVLEPELIILNQSAIPREPRVVDGYPPVVGVSGGERQVAARV